MSRVRRGSLRAEPQIWARKGSLPPRSGACAPPPQRSVVLPLVLLSLAAPGEARAQVEFKSTVALTGDLLRKGMRLLPPLVEVNIDKIEVNLFPSPDKGLTDASAELGRRYDEIKER